MAKDPSPCHCFPAEILGHAVWHYQRFSLIIRDIEE